MSKKNLDKLFQEKFNGFKDTPDERVWQAIESSLDKRSKKRIVPLWWKLGGAAAILVLALTVFGLFSTSEKALPSVTDTETLNPVNGKEQQGTPSIFSEEDAVAEEQLSETTKQKSGANTKNEASKKLENLATEDQNLHEPSTESVATAVANNTTAISSKDQLASSDKRSLRETDTSTVVLKSNVSNKVSGRDSNLPLAQQALANREENSINRETHKAESSPSKSEIVENELEKTPSDDKKSLFEEIEEQSEAEEKIAENTQSRWSVGPNVAPVYFDAIGEGSPIHSAFDQNTKSGNTNLSYGLSVAYEVNKKFKVRSGFIK